MANKLSVSGDVKHILVEDEETEGKTLITCGDWTKAEELGVTDYAKEVWTEELLKKFEDMQASLAPTEYIRSRASAYDSIGNQLDMIYKDNLNGTTTHKESVEAVKAKYPKPE
jgi:hypothetical protein